MSPKHVTERDDNAGDELVGQTGHSNGTALQTRGSGIDVGANLPATNPTNLPDTSDSSNALSQDDSPEEMVVRDASDIISDAILEAAPPLMREHLVMLREQYDSAMHMHRHYKEIAVNGTEADIGPTSADDMAVTYLRQAGQISQTITSMLNEMLRTSTKKTLDREKMRGRSSQKLPDGAKVTQNNTVINFGEASQREKLRMMSDFAGDKKLNGSLGIPDAKTLIARVTDTGDDENDEVE